MMLQAAFQQRTIIVSRQITNPDLILRDYVRCKGVCGVDEKFARILCETNTFLYEMSEFNESIAMFTGAGIVQLLDLSRGRCMRRSSDSESLGTISEFA
jgi:hypothetical protein